MKEIAPGIYIETSYPPYNLALIQTPRGAVVVDIPPHPVHAMNWREQVRAVAGEIAYAVLTDASPERVIATAWWDVPLIASEVTLRRLAAYDEERALRDWLQKVNDRYPDEVPASPGLRPRKPTVAFDEHFFLHYRTPALEFEAVAGAAPGSLWLFVPDEALLFAGDTVASDDVLPLEHTPDSKAWLNTLGTLAHRQSVQRIVPGRGRAPILRGEIEDSREFLRVTRRSARSLVRGTVKLSEAAQDIGQTLFNGQGQPAVKAIRRGLERLVAEIKEAQAEEEEE